MFVSWSLVVIIWQAGFPLKSNTAHPPRLLFFNWKLFVHSRHKFSFRFEVVTTCIAIKTLLTVFKTDPNQTENVSKHYMVSILNPGFWSWMEPTTFILVVGPRKLVCTDFIGVVRPAYRRRIISPLYPIIPAPSRSHPLFALPCFGSEKVGFSKNASRKTLKKLFKLCFSKRTRQRGHFALRLAIIRFLSSENEFETYFTWRQ